MDGLNPYQPAGYYNKLGVWCNKNDIMCGSNLNILHPMKGHTSYNSENGYEKFARLIFEKLSEKTDKIKPTDARYSDSKKRDIVIIYDFNQMASYEFRQRGNTIEDGLKERLVELANHGTRIAVYNAYSLQEPVKHLEQKIDFTNDNLDEKIERYNEENRCFFGYNFGRADNNFRAIKEVIETADWSTGSEKHIFLIENTYHDEFESNDGTKYSDVIALARQENVKISIISTDGSENTGNYKDMVMETGGTLIGDDYSKIALEKTKAKKLFSKTFQINQNSKYTLVVINGVVYGLSDKKSITVTDLNLLRENTIIFSGYDATGKKKRTEIINLRSGKIKTPDTGVV